MPRMHSLWLIAGVATLIAATTPVMAQSACATRVIHFDPAPGQWVNDPLYNDPNMALGWPLTGDPNFPENGSLVSLGGFGGSLTLAFDEPVIDDPANPFGVDAIIFGNAHWVLGDPTRRWAEAGVIEISRDTNANGLADDAWYLIPGAHINTPGYPADHVVATWDDDLDDETYPPHLPLADEFWIPPDRTGVWTTTGFRLPGDIYDATVLGHPNGPSAIDEVAWGYADLSPSRPLPDGTPPEDFYTRPDHPLKVGITPGSGGGDAFDIAWAIDPNTGLPANLDGFDFIRITTAVDVVVVQPPFGEKSTEIDAVVDVAAGRMGDVENDGDIDAADFATAVECWFGPEVIMPSCPCTMQDFDQDHDVDLIDFADLQVAFGGS